MAPTSSSTAPKKSTQIEKKITTRVAPKPILSKPAVLKENASNIQKEVLSQQAHGSIIERMSQRIETIGNDFEMVLYQIVNKLKLLEDGQNEIKVSFEKNQQNFEEIMEKIGSFDSRFEQLSTGPTQNPIFTREQIAQARDTLGLDLNQELVHNGRYLITAAPFNKNNINLYGTKLLSILFTKEELANGTVEPIRTRVQSLDQERIDMIKMCYIKKLKSIETFVDCWPSIVKSLRQKCLDSKRKSKDDSKDNEQNGNGETEDEQRFYEEEDEDDDNGNDEDSNRQGCGQRLGRDISMASLQN